jgi:hypothetical protein
MNQIVIDTNVFVAAGFNHRSASARILGAVREGCFQLVWNKPTRRETETILRRIPRLSLALRAMTDGHDPRFAGDFHAQRPAAATGDPGHQKLLFGAVATIRYHRRYVICPQRLGEAKSPLRFLRGPRSTWRCYCRGFPEWTLCGLHGPLLVRDHELKALGPGLAPPVTIILAIFASRGTGACPGPCNLPVHSAICRGVGRSLLVAGQRRADHHTGRIGVRTAVISAIAGRAASECRRQYQNNNQYQSLDQNTTAFAPSARRTVLCDTLGFGAIIAN